MLFMTMPTIAETIAPDTPPPTSWPTSAPISMPPVAPASAGISEVRSDPPAAPPRAPAMVLPAGPKIHIFHRRADSVAADRAADELDDEVDNCSRHGVSSVMAAKSQGRYVDELL